MSSFPSVSLILFAKDGQTDQIVWQAVGALGKAQWRSQVLVIRADQNSAMAERITYRPIPPQFNTVGEAIAAAKHPLIAFVEPGVQIDVDQWNLMAKRLDQSPVQTTYYVNGSYDRNAVNQFERALFWVYCMVVRLFLRTGKTEFHPGVTLIKKDLIKNPTINSIADDYIPCTGLPTPLTITRLIALARLNKQAVLETQIGGRVPDPIHQPPGSNRIRQAIGNALRFWWNQVMFPNSLRDLPTRKYKPLEQAVATTVLLLIAAFILFRSLSFPLFEPDEARNAQLAMNVVQSGQWMSLTLAEENYWDKPPLQIWAVATSYKLFGVSQFATRFPVAIAAMMTLLFSLFIGKRLIGFRAAWIGTFMLLLTTGFVAAGRYVTMDTSLTTMTTAMLLLGFLAIDRGFKRRYAFAAGIACGLGVLIKGPVIGVLCLPPLLALYWLASNAGLPTNQSSAASPSWASRLLWFATPAFLIAAPWFIATAMIHPDFVTYFFWKHHVVRFSDAFNHREPFWYYFVGIFIFMFPASYLIPSVTKFLTSRKPEYRSLRTREHGFLFLSAAWIIGFFSLSESKLPTYIVPAFPMVCLLMGVLIEQKVLSKSAHSLQTIAKAKRRVGTRRSWLENLGRRVPVEICCWFIISGLAIAIYLKTESFSAISLLSNTAIVSLLVLLSLYYRRKPRIAWALTGLIGLFMVSLATHQLIPSLSTQRSIHNAASNIRSSNEFQTAPVVFFGRESYGVELTINEDDVVLFDETQTKDLVDFLADNPTSIIVSSEDPMEVLRRDLPWTISLEECEDARHLYLSRPNRSVFAQQSDPTLRR